MAIPSARAAVNLSTNLFCAFSESFWTSSSISAAVHVAEHLRDALVNSAFRMHAYVDAAGNELTRHCHRTMHLFTHGRLLKYNAKPTSKNG